jgi:hypothetical protein
LSYDAVAIPRQCSGLVQKVSLFPCERVQALVRRQPTALDLIDDAFGEASYILIELYARDAERQMASADGQCLSEQVAGGMLNVAQGMTWIDQPSSPHEEYPVVPAL